MINHQEHENEDKEPALSELYTLRKKLKIEAQALIDEGKTKGDIYDRLLANNNPKLNQLIAFITAYLVPTPLFQKNRLLFKGLLLAQVGIMIAIACTYYCYFSYSIINVSWFVLGLTILVQAYIFKNLVQFNGHILSIIVIFKAIEVWRTINNLYTKDYGDVIPICWGINVLLAILMIVIAYYLQKQLYPNLPFRGPTKNASGKYEFGD